MYSMHNEGKSVATEKFKKGKIYKKMTVIDKKYYLPYWNKLVDEYDSNYRHSVGKKPVDADYSALTKEIETNAKAPQFKFGDRVRNTKYKNICSKGYTKNLSREPFVIDSVLKI